MYLANSPEPKPLAARGNRSFESNRTSASDLAQCACVDVVLMAVEVAVVLVVVS